MPAIDNPLEGVFCNHSDGRGFDLILTNTSEDDAAIYVMSPSHSLQVESPSRQPVRSGSEFAPRREGPCPIESKGRLKVSFHLAGMFETVSGECTIKTLITVQSNSAESVFAFVGNVELTLPTMDAFRAERRRNHLDGDHSAIADLIVRKP